MDDELFEYQFNETGVTITKYIGNQPVVDIPSEIDGQPVTEIGKEAFKKCDFVKAVHIPDTVELISEFAFADCSSLTEIMIPDSVRRINAQAFNEELKSVILPEQLIDAGHNFTLTKEVMCECGQMYRINLLSPCRAVCPRCGSMRFAVPVSTNDIMKRIIIFIVACIAEVYIYFWMMENFSFWIGGILGSYTFFLLIAECACLSSFRAFQSSVNPALAKRERSEWESALMWNSQENADKDYFSELPPLQEYHHQNISFKSVVLLFDVFFIGFILVWGIVHMENFDNILEQLKLPAIIALIGVCFFHVLFRITTSQSELTMNSKGIQFSKWNPDLVPWENIMSFHIILTKTSIPKGVNVKLRLNDNKKRKFVLTYGNLIEMDQGIKVLLEFVGRYQPKLLETATFREM